VTTNDGGDAKRKEGRGEGDETPNDLPKQRRRKGALFAFLFSSVFSSQWKDDCSAASDNLFSIQDPAGDAKHKRASCSDLLAITSSTFKNVADTTLLHFFFFHAQLGHV
jgi:hypothetical protein